MLHLYLFLYIIATVIEETELKNSARTNLLVDEG